MSLLTAEAIAGSPKRPVAVLLHGFTQNRHCWGQFAAALSRDYWVWALDLPGHGASDHRDESFEGAVGLVAETLRTLPFTSELLVGYSMGGRMALAALTEDSTLTERAALIGTTAGLETERQRANRRRADGVLADKLREVGPEQFLDYWLNLPMFASLNDAQSSRESRLAHWGVGVAETLELRGTGCMESLWSKLDSVEVPITIVAGDRDEKFTAIGRRLAVAIGANATFRAVAGAGHACHLEEPSTVAELLR